MSAEHQFNYADIIGDEPGMAAVRCLGGAAFALVVKQPDDRKIWDLMAAAPEQQPLQPPVAEIAQEVRKFAVARRGDTRMSADQIARFAGTLIQFTDINPIYESKPITEWRHVESLLSGVIDQSKEAPLSFAQQLEVAYEQADGDLAVSLARLFITSRHMARWSDGSLIQDEPGFSDQEKIKFMEEWRGAVAACKPVGESVVQDTAGDTYYAWTHVLAKVAFGTMANRGSGALERLFHNGTTIMQRYVNSRVVNKLNPFNPGGTVSDHTIAAIYGNNIGKALLH